jgi:hypothetical protein
MGRKVADALMVQRKQAKSLLLIEHCKQRIAAEAVVAHDQVAGRQSPVNVRGQRCFMRAQRCRQRIDRQARAGVEQ